MILSVSRRTDIPAFYSEWFLRRIREGYVYVRNPMNPHQISSVSLSPEAVDCIVFWTKDPSPMLCRLNELDGYKYYFQYTLNNYGREIEPNIPPLEARLEAFAELSEKIGRERVIWRYDPILFTDHYTAGYHLESFSRLADELSGYTEKCVFSFVDIYPSKNGGRLSRIGSRPLSEGELDSFIKGLSEIAAAHDLTLASCAENINGSEYGIIPNSCIDRELIERLIGAELNIKPDGQRANCRCVKCDDIGSYDTCPHGCIYCYANYRPENTNKRLCRYDAGSPLLCDSVDAAADRITVRAVSSCKKPKPAFSEEAYTQLDLFDNSLSANGDSSE
ncbi:MAG: DUF1848 domain-containing protein [Oscillospiraceae bacterium]|nr:DUF1848 domain-containing protein [Oscillospiraceae bacterium]